MISLTQLPAHGAVFILVALSLCDAALLSTLANFTKGKAVLTSYRTIQPYSKARCVEKCVEEGLAGWCSVAGYVTATRTCHLSLDSDQDVVDVNDAMLGVFFMTNERSCDVGEALVSGHNPIPDAYMTASSEYNDFHGPRHARINGTSGIGGWLCHSNESTAPEPRMYLQVKFLDLSTVVAVQTRGRASNLHWITQYRLELSHDCTTFRPVLDGSGLNMTFPANTDNAGLVVNHLPTPKVARCVRLFPLAWNNLPVVRMEVVGCPLV